MGSIVPGAGAVPGAGKEDPRDGSWGWGGEGSPAFGEPESGDPRKETTERKSRIQQLGGLREREAWIGRDTGHRV